MIKRGGLQPYIQGTWMPAMIRASMRTAAGSASRLGEGPARGMSLGLALLFGLGAARAWSQDTRTERWSIYQQRKFDPRQPFAGAKPPSIPQELVQGVDPDDIRRKIEDSQKAPDSVAGASEVPIVKTCYRFYRLIEWKDAYLPDSSYKYYEDRGSYLSPELLPNMVGIWVTWGYINKARDLGKAQGLWIAQLTWIKNSLHSRVSLEAKDFPMDGGPFEVLWEREQVFSLDRTYFFTSVIFEKDFRISVTLTQEPDIQKCGIPQPHRPTPAPPAGSQAP